MDFGNSGRGPQSAPRGHGRPSAYAKVDRALCPSGPPPNTFDSRSTGARCHGQPVVQCMRPRPDRQLPRCTFTFPTVDLRCPSTTETARARSRQPSHDRAAQAKATVDLRHIQGGPVTESAQNRAKLVHGRPVLNPRWTGRRVKPGSDPFNPKIYK